MNQSEKRTKEFLSIGIIMAGAAISFILPQLLGSNGGMFTSFFIWLAIAGPALLMLALSGDEEAATEQESARCANCGKYYAGVARFCPNCGKPV